MTNGGAAPTAAHRAGSAMRSLIRAWRTLPHERRLAAYGAGGLFVTLFLPWYQETVIASGTTNLRSVSATLTGWGAFSFVEAAVLLLGAGVLTLLYQRAEGRAFHLPGGDGWVIMAAGFWTCVLIVWRIFDKQGTSSHGQLATTAGIEWGIFVALAVAAFLAYAGSRIRAAHQPEPPLPGDDVAVRDEAGVATAARPVPPETAAPPETPAPPAPPATPDRSRRVRPPRPVPADDPPTRRMPSRPRRDADEQLTIPLDGED
jgi:hypothetical protein